MPFSDRIEAGRRLGVALGHLRGQPIVVLGLPRGGVPVAAEVARALSAPLDVVLVRKLGVPGQRELAMGAIGEGGVRLLHEDVVSQTGVTTAQIEEVEGRERAELERQAELFRPAGASHGLAGQVVVIVDDGLATGSTAQAACRSARARGAARVVLAVPVAPPGWAARMAQDADELVALETPAHFFAIGQFYDDFRATSDEEVIARLAASGRDVG